MAGVQKVNLNQLNINLKNALIIGAVIAKNNPKIFGQKKKGGDMRGVMSFTLRDSKIDTINCDVWGSDCFILAFYERFTVGDVVEISSPKIMVKTGDNENFRPHVSSPFCLAINENQSDAYIHTADTYSSYLPLLHLPTKLAAGYYGLAEILKLPEGYSNTYVDLLVVVKCVNPTKCIKTKAGTDMTVRSVEIADNTTPASILLDMFDLDTIRRADKWRPNESVLFIADARVNWRNKATTVQVCSKTVITHQPHTTDAESLRLYMRNLSETRGGEIAAWNAWSGERSSAASVCQVKDRIKAATPFCASLHGLLTHFDLNDLTNTDGSTSEPEDIRVRFADHTGELNARLPINVLETALSCSLPQLRAMSDDDRSALRWALLLEQCTAKLAASPQKLIVLELRRASPADPIPLY